MEPGCYVTGVTLSVTAHEKLDDMVPDGAICVQNPRAAQFEVQLKFSVPLQLREGGEGYFPGDAMLALHDLQNTQCNKIAKAPLLESDSPNPWATAFDCLRMLKTFT
jgi:hypothetical protein